MREKFHELALPLHGDLYRLALALCGNEQDALDLTQATYLKAFRNFDSFREGSNFKAWMIRIMKNAHIDVMRRRKHERISQDLADETLEPAVAPGEAWEVKAVLPDDMAKAFRELDPWSRAIILLLDVQGFKYREIAETMEVPIGTVMSKIHRARVKLRALLLRQRVSS